MVDVDSDSTDSDTAILLNQRSVVGLYYTNWSNYDEAPHGNNRFPSDLALGDISHLFYAFFSIEKDTGCIVSLDPYADFQIEREFCHKGKQYKAKGLIEECVICRDNMTDVTPFKLIMSVGGWGAGQLFTSIVKSEAKIRRFVSSAINLMLDYGFDGIDIDWEYPSGHLESSRLIQLLSCLRQEISRYANGVYPVKKVFTVSMASPAGWEQLKNLDLSRMDRYIHFWNVMTYDFAGSWSSKVGYHSNLFSPVDSEKAPPFALTSDEEDNFRRAESEILERYPETGPVSCNAVIQYYLNRGISPGKLVLGIPCYGRMFLGTKGYGKNFKSVKTRQFPEGIVKVSQIPSLGLKTRYIPISGTAYAFDDRKKLFLTYDDMNVLKAKTKFCVDRGLGGAFFWDNASDFPHSGNSSYLVYFSKNIEHLKAEQDVKLDEAYYDPR